MDIEQIMHRAGGVADRASLVRLTSRRDVDGALRTGVIVRDGHGCYALPVANEALRCANALNGVVSHRSAAIHHGWSVKTVPARPDVTVPKNRKVTDRRRIGTTLHRAFLGSEDMAGRVTSVERTLGDCLRTLPFDESLAVADSPLRQCSVPQGALVERAARVRGTGAPSARRVAAAADERAANPFESTLRALALDVPGLDFVPQLPIHDRNFSVQPDLVDPGTGLSSRRTPSPVAATARRCAGTLSATRTSSRAAGWCFASPGKTSCTTPDTSVASSRCSLR